MGWGGERGDFHIHHFHIDYNAPCLPPKILRNHCFQFLLGITVIPREIEDNGYTKFWGVNEVPYGLCENGELKWQGRSSSGLTTGYPDTQQPP